MNENLFQKGEDIVFNVNTTHIEGYTESTPIQMLIYRDGSDFTREDHRNKIVVLEPVRKDSELVFTATHEQTATMCAGEYSIELVYTIDGNRSIMKSAHAFALEESAANHVNTQD